MAEVKLIGITKPYIDGITSAEEFVAYCARVSNPTNQLNTGTVDKLLKYLVKNKHWSPFEMVSIVMEIKTTRDIGRQILRHRSFSFQEFSQRYAKVDTDGFIVDREARLQDLKNRQNSIDLAPGEKEALQKEWEEWQDAVVVYALKGYQWALDNNLAKEVARSVLPEGLTPTHMYMSGSLRSWIHYCDLRMGNGTQKEHQDIAKECWSEICKEIPALSEILDRKEEGKQ